MNSFHFQAPEYYHRHKTADWYWAVGIVSLSAIVTSIILGNFLLAVLLLIATLLLSVYASRPPHELDIEISDRGITIGKYRFSYSNMESFWIEHHEYPRLLIKTNRTLLPHVVIPVGDLSEEEKNEIREFLKTKLPEEEQTEPLLEQIMEYLGF